MEESSRHMLSSSNKKCKLYTRTYLKMSKIVVFQPQGHDLFDKPIPPKILQLITVTKQELLSRKGNKNNFMVGVTTT